VAKTRRTKSSLKRRPRYQQDRSLKNRRKKARAAARHRRSLKKVKVRRLRRNRLG
jgi:hypothetical protein